MAAAATRQHGFEITRSVRIKAPPAAIFPWVDDFHRWVEWSPFEVLDRDMARTYQGPAAGRGAIYAWNSKGKAGAGRMEILESAPGDRIIIQLDFLRPMKARNTARFVFEPMGDTTKVTWSMTGSLNAVMKIVHRLFNMDRMVGRDFEAGLANLKAVAEA